MTDAAGLAVLVAGAALGVAGPVALAHYGRAPADRLGIRLLAVVALACLLGAVSTVRWLGFGPPAGPPDVVAVGVGVVAGLAGLGVYGVLERRVVPSLERGGAGE